MIYLKKFQTDTDYQAFKASSDWVTPNVSAIEEDNSVIYEGIEQISTSTFILEWNGDAMMGLGYEHMEFEFEPGMTVNDWLSSEYNTYGFTLCNESGRNNNWQYYYNGVSDVIDINGLSPTTIIEEKLYYFSSTYCCFVAGTQVMMSDGTNKNIEDVVVGDKVLSLNIETNELYETIVKKTITNPRAVDIAKVTLENGNSVTMNAYHPLLTMEGWKSLTNYNNYPTLSVDDNVVTSDLTPVKISNIERWSEETPIMTYTLNVIDKGENPDDDINDNFFANGICAHNAMCPI